MTDTPRTLAAVLSLLADNTTNNISPQDLRDVVVSLTSPVAAGGFDHIGEAGVYDVIKWGALANGSHDDTTNIQAAIDACAAAGGGIVYFPPGTYKITATLIIDEATSSNYRNVSLVGAGSQCTTINNATTTADTAIFWGTTRGVSAGLTAPKAMSLMQGFALQGPGRTNANSIGIHSKEASYYEFHDIIAFDYETSFYFDTGNSFHTGATLIRLRTLGCKYGYRFDDKGESGSSGGECTDMSLYSCYAHPGSSALAGSVGFWFARANTCWTFRCSAELFDYGFMLGVSGVGGTSGLNNLYSCRTESIVVEEGIIYDGDDNWIFGGTATWNDTTAAQGNIIIGGKHNVAGDAATPDREPRIIRPITAAKLPTPNATNRGKLFYRPGNAGTADTLVMCKKSAADVYSWVNIS